MLISSFLRLRWQAPPRLCEHHVVSLLHGMFNGTLLQNEWKSHFLFVFFVFFFAREFCCAGHFPNIWFEKNPAIYLSTVKNKFVPEIICWWAMLSHCGAYVWQHVSVANNATRLRGSLLWLYCTVMRKSLMLRERCKFIKKSAIKYLISEWVTNDKD